MASYADDATLFKANKTNDLEIKQIEHLSKVLFHWFDLNYMKIISGKCHIQFSGNDNVSVNINNKTIISENKNELLGIILDLRLIYSQDHMTNLCKKQVKHLTF